MEFSLNPMDFGSILPAQHKFPHLSFCYFASYVKLASFIIWFIATKYDNLAAFY